MDLANQKKCGENWIRKKSWFCFCRKSNDKSDIVAMCTSPPTCWEIKDFLTTKLFKEYKKCLLYLGHNSKKLMRLFSYYFWSCPLYRRQAFLKHHPLYRQFSEAMPSRKMQGLRHANNRADQSQSSSSPDGQGDCLIVTPRHDSSGADTTKVEQVAIQTLMATKAGILPCLYYRLGAVEERHGFCCCFLLLIQSRQKL